MSLLDKLVNKQLPNSIKIHQYCWYSCRLILKTSMYIVNQPEIMPSPYYSQRSKKKEKAPDLRLIVNYCLCVDKSHDERFLSAISVCISTVASHFSCAEEPAFCNVLFLQLSHWMVAYQKMFFCLEQLNNFFENLHSVS